MAASSTSNSRGRRFGIDAGQVSQMLAERAEDVCRWLLPGGRMEGPEWRVGSVDGEQGKSMAVHLHGEKAGVWQDFATGVGGDLIDLIAACETLTFPGALKRAKEFLGVKDERPALKSPKKAYVRPERPKRLTAPKSEMVRWFEGRGISQDTLASAQVGEEPGKDGPDIVFPYKTPIDEGGDLYFIKYRAVRDKKRMRSSKDSERILFGWHTLSTDVREVVIVEGEIDQLSFLEKGIPALSVPNGGGSKGKQDCWLDADFERLQRFSTIYLALDNDETGREARDYILERLGRHRCRVVEFPSGIKDANDALKAGIDLKGLLAKARSADPAEMVAAETLVDMGLDILSDGMQVRGESLPWNVFSGTVFLCPGETSVWMGVNGHGKSQVVQHMVVESMARGCRWLVASMEYRPEMLMSRISRQIVGKACPTRDGDGLAIVEFVRDRLWLYDASADAEGNAGPDRILEVFEYAFHAHGVDHFVIDSLAKIGIAEDDYAGQQAFARKLSNFDRRLGVHTHLVAHVRKLQDESYVPDKFDLKGSGGIGDLVDNIFVVWRNKPGEMGAEGAQEGDAVLRCVKQRCNGWEGGAVLWFDRQALQYSDRQGAAPIDYARGGGR